MGRWTDRFVADRMAVDRAFGERVAASEFSSQEWGTIMTAVEFEIEDADDPQDARVVADTSSVDQVLPALEEMQQNVGAAVGAAQGGSGSGGRGGASGGANGGSGGGSGGGLFGSLLDLLGLGGSDRADRAEAAAALAEDYARQFQEHLEREGKWEQACEVAASDGDAGIDIEDGGQRDGPDGGQRSGSNDRSSAGDEG